MFVHAQLCSLVSLFTALCSLKKGTNVVIRLISLYYLLGTVYRRKGVGLRARVEAGSYIIWAVCCKLSAEYHSGITAVLQVVRMHSVYNICAG